MLRKMRRWLSGAKPEMGARNPLPRAPETRDARYDSDNRRDQPPSSQTSDLKSWTDACVALSAFLDRLSCLSARHNDMKALPRRRRVRASPPTFGELALSLCLSRLSRLALTCGVGCQIQKFSRAHRSPRAPAPSTTPDRDHMPRGWAVGRVFGFLSCRGAWVPVGRTPAKRQNTNVPPERDQRAPRPGGVVLRVH